MVPWPQTECETSAAGEILPACRTSRRFLWTSGGHALVGAAVRHSARAAADLRAFGLGDLVHAIVSSVDTLWRKPDRRFYDLALRAAGVPAKGCLIVGNSEAKDIVPSVALGTLAVRVAIEEDRPAASWANFICDSLEQVGAIVRGIHQDG